MDWNKAFSGDPSAVLRAVERVRAARREFENVIRRISVEKEDVDAPLTPAARWTRQERLRDGYERQCKLVAVAEVELLRAVLNAATVGDDNTDRADRLQRVVSAG